MDRHPQYVCHNYSGFSVYLFTLLSMNAQCDDVHIEERFQNVCIEILVIIKGEEYLNMNA